MKDRSEGEVQTVFRHWCERNRDCNKGRSRDGSPSRYQDVREAAERRGIEFRRMQRQMDWEHCLLLSMDETLGMLDSGGETGVGENS